MAESLHEMAKRLCNQYDDCEGCPVDCGYQYCAVGTYAALTEADIAAQLEMLRAWAAANPVKSYKDDFFEKLSGAGKQPDGYPLLHVISLYEIAESRRDEYRKAKHHDEWDKPLGYLDAPLGTWGEKEKGKGMSEKMAVRCPWCPDGVRMLAQRESTGMVRGVDFMVCPKCFSRGPAIETVDGQWEGKQAAAYSAAMARYVEANRVLTLAEWRMVERDLEDDVLFTPYWVEHRHPNGFWNQWVDCWEDHQSFAAQLEKYGTEWRPWARKPTTKEKEETPW